MKEDLDKIDAKIDGLVESLHSVDKTLAVQAEQLREHMRRSDALEDLVETHKHMIGAQVNSLKGEMKEIIAEVEPIKRHVNGLNWVWKALLALGGLAAAIHQITKLL